MTRVINCDPKNVDYELPTSDTETQLAVDDRVPVPDAEFLDAEQHAKDTNDHLLPVKKVSVDAATKCEDLLSSLRDGSSQDDVVMELLGLFCTEIETLKNGIKYISITFIL